MARRDKLWAEAEENWPTLQNSLACYLHQTWPEISGSPEAALDESIQASDLERKRAIAKEWRAWKKRYSSIADPRPIVNDGFGVCVRFRKADEAHQFMDLLYEKLIGSIKEETQHRTER